MTRILDLPTLGFDFTVWNNEDWSDSSYQYLDGTGALVPFDGIGLEFVVRRAASDSLVFASASTTGLIGGLPASGMIFTTVGSWGLSIPQVAMRRIPPGAYVWEMQAFAERVETIGFGAVTVKQGVVR